MRSRQFIGLGIGASRIKLVSASADLQDREVAVRDHHGNPRGVLEDMLKDVDPASVAGLAVTGRDGTSLISGRKVFESEAIEEGLHVLGLRADVVVSLGGEAFVVYPIGPDGAVIDSLSGNRCAAGTVEFFKQQLGRMGLTVGESAGAAQDGKIVPLAKRCSVHCKSDCTHALNKRKCSVSDIVRTLCHNMAEKVAGLIGTTGTSQGTIVVIGGAAANPVIIEHIRQLLPQFSIVVPEEAPYFEALGAAAIARNRSLQVPAAWADLFKHGGNSFGVRPALGDYLDRVTYLHSRRGTIRPEGRYILGVDGGSTTTKVALVDADTLEICGSHYTKTNGNPEKAMKECLARLEEQVAAAGAAPRIVGVGTTGSSGEILSVLCRTPWYHNEIIAHSYGAYHFCPDVDTLFEIGGQDSKFTSLRAGVAVDFNMNESCSAGTGSFIEETARDDLNVPLEQIADLALRSARPPRFSDQCAAFANSDTRKAFQEGASKEDNLAGLVYAIVDNYVNKVVGRRKIGDHILFQGGTSKNKAIACAFAAKTGRRITIPPDSELMGCFGIALWLREKLLSGDAEEKACSIGEIRETTVAETKEFTCKGCENFCSIQNLTIRGEKYPFGGQCSRWENVRKHRTNQPEDFDLVARRNQMLFREYGVPPAAGNGAKPVIGLQAVFSTYALYPLYSWFFHELGYAIDLSERVDPRGVQRCQSARCYPYEIAHGTFEDLRSRGVKTIFVPHVVGLPRDNGSGLSVVCPIAQAVPYYLASAFGENGVTVHDPVLDMTAGIEAVEQAFVKMAAEMGHDAADARAAFRKGSERQRAFWAAAKAEGAKILAELERENRLGIVLVGRPYNAFSNLANMGLPRKFASSGVTIIPCDFLPYEAEECDGSMYWKYGQVILKSLQVVKKSPNLFAVYVSNFGCGPDSFIQHFADAVMGRKPYLYLEFDSHTADAGVATRVAAFLDIIAGYRRLGEKEEPRRAFIPAEFVTEGDRSFVQTSRGERLPLTHPRVTLAFPSMGRYNTEAMAAAGRRCGIRAIALPPADDRTLSIGKEFTSGKECSPAILTIGSLITYCREHLRREREDEVLVFFMPTADGPCRFGQYNVYIKRVIRMLELEDVVVYSPSAEDGYRGLGTKFMLPGWLGVIVANIMSDIRAVLNVAAEDRGSALGVFEAEWARVREAIAHGYGETWRALKPAARALSRLKLKTDPARVPKVLLAGEIFVRCDELSCRGIDDHYADEGLMIKRADAAEWVYFRNWYYLHHLAGRDGFPKDFLSGRFFLRKVWDGLFKGEQASRRFAVERIELAFEQWVERKVRRILGRSGLLVTEQHSIDHVVRRGTCFLNPALDGEAILTAGATVEVMEHSPKENYCGVVFIGPFNCMPNGVAESLIKPYARRKGIPYMTFETDGGPVPTNLKSQMEVHMLRSRRYAAAREPKPVL